MFQTDLNHLLHLCLHTALRTQVQRAIVAFGDWNSAAAALSAMHAGAPCIVSLAQTVFLALSQRSGRSELFGVVPHGWQFALGCSGFAVAAAAALAQLASSRWLSGATARHATAASAAATAQVRGV
jgi:hypothetical protein